MFISKYIDNGDVESNWRMDHGDYLKVSKGGYAFDITVGYKAELKVTTSGAISGVTVTEGGDASFTSATVIDAAASYDAKAYFNGCYIEGLSVSGARFYAKNSQIYDRITISDMSSTSLEGSELYGTITISNIDTLNADNTLFDGTVTIDYTDMITEGSAICGDLTLIYSDVTVDIVSVDTLSVTDGSTLSAYEIFVDDGPTTISNSVLQGIMEDDEIVGTFEAAGDVVLKDGAEMKFAETKINGNVSVSNAFLFTGTAVISGTLSVNSSAKVYASNCILDSVDVSGKSELIVNGGIRIDALNIGTSSFADLNNTVASGVRVGSSAYLYASATEINGLSVNSKGSAVIYNKASATGIQNADGGYVEVFSGGVIGFGGRIESGSELFVKAGGTLRDVNIFSGAVVNGFNIGFTSTYYVSGSAYTARDYSVNGGAGWGAEISRTPTDHYFNYDNDEKCGLVIIDAYVKGFESGVIYSGQIANDITVSYGGQAHISNGASMTSARILNMGSLYVSNGGKLTSAGVISGGVMTVYKGGNAAAVGVSSGGVLHNSGTINTAGFTSGANVSIYGGGIINNALASSGANINIQTGGAFNGIVSSGAKLKVESGAAVNGVSATASTFMSNGVHFSSGAVVNGAGSLAAGQTADNITVNTGGTLNVASGAEITDANANGGTINLAGTLSGGEINANGKINVASGGKADDVTVNSGDLTVSGGKVEDVIVSGGKMNILAGSAVDVDIVSGAVTVSGGSIDDVVNSAGILTVLSGGSFDSAVLLGGVTTVASGAQAGSLSMSGGVFNQQSGAVINGFVFESNYTHSGALNYSGAIVKSGADAQLYSGEKASDVKVYGDMTVNSGAVANATKVLSGGELDIHGSAADTVVSSAGSAYVGANGYAANTTVADGGKLTVADGGVIAQTTVNAANTVDISSGGIASDTVVQGPGSVNVYSGGLMSGGEITSNGSVQVNNGGTIAGFDIVSGAVSLAGSANSNTVYSKGILTVSSGAVAENTTILTSGLMTVLDGGTASNTTVNSRGVLAVDNGGTIAGLTAKNGAIINGLTVQNDQTADKFLLSGAVVSCHSEAALYNNQSAANAIVLSSAMLHVYSGGVVDGANVSHGGIFASGGVVNGAVLHDYAMMLARSGAIVNNTDLQHGELFVYDATANSTVVKSYGSLYVNSGVLNSTLVANGYVSGSKDSQMYGTVLRGGTLITKGYAQNTTVVAGTLSAAEKAVVKDSVISGGTLMLMDSAVHSGTMCIANGAVVSASAKATIDFTVAGRPTNDTYIINNLSQITGNPNYSITIDVWENNGIYNLAQGVGTFTKNVLIKNTADTDMLYVSTKDKPIHYEGKLYSLVLNDGNLSLKISRQERSSISVNGVSQIVAWDAGRGTVGMVATTVDAGASWKGIWDWSDCCGTGSLCCVDKWKVVGTGRFAGTDINTDGILLYNNENNTFAAWSNINSADYGYISLCHVDANFSVSAIGNFNNNSYDDIIIYDEKGNFGVVIDGTTYYDIWHGDASIELIGAGYFGNANGTDSLLVKNTADNKYYFLNNSDTTFSSWAWSFDNNIAGVADSDWEIAAIGDFQGDFIDDIIVWQKSTGYMFAWENGNSQNQRWVGALDNSDWEVAAVGDYNGDGKEDLLLRELLSGWGGVGYWGAANADNWVDLNARVENNAISNYTIIA